MMHQVHHNRICTVHHAVIFRLRRKYPHPAPDKRACRSSGGVCEVDSMSKLIEPRRMGLHNYDAHMCIIIMERYRSGHNGADSKSVCAQAHEGSNPSLSAIKITSGFLPLVIFISERDSNGCAMNDSPVRLSERTLTEPAGESESLSKREEQAPPLPPQAARRKILA